MSYLDFLQLSPGLAVEVVKSLYIRLFLCISRPKSGSSPYHFVIISMLSSSIVSGGTLMELLIHVHWSDTYGKRGALLALSFQSFFQEENVVFSELRGFDGLGHFNLF